MAELDLGLRGTCRHAVADQAQRVQERTQPWPVIGQMDAAARRHGVLIKGLERNAAGLRATKQQSCRLAHRASALPVPAGARVMQGGVCHAASCNRLY
ncbi:hypothetical protein [Natronocella acetinitrilica]|uniref:hypothetical protein n=1 Tax=Natronocella acetinitrilica TaxID=414046 RepID=UPI00209DFE5A|nr:hypothetical protein [Natronocella acetinitrilica]